MDVNESIALYTAVTAIATVVSAIIALIIAWKSSEPVISVINQMDENDNLTMDLVVENIGSGIAYDVQFEAIPDIPIIDIQNISEIGLFKNGLRYFPPHQKIKLFLQWMPGDYENIISRIYDIRVSYKNWIGLKRVEHFPIDFTLFGVHPLPQHPSVDIAESLKNIDRNIGSSIKLSKVNVVAYTKNEEEEEIRDRVVRASEKKKSDTG